MRKRLERADRAFDGHVKQAMRKWHADLAEAKIHVVTVLVHPELDDNGEPKGPALRHAGAACTAKINVASPKERLLADCDAIMEIDGHLLESLSAEQRTALIDHELEHLVLRKDKKGLVARHDDGHPKLSTRPDDWCLTGFVSVAQRHKHNALEAQALGRLFSECQGLFEFMSEPAATTEPNTRRRSA